MKCSHHPCTEPTSCQHCSRRGKSDNSAAQAMGRTIDEPFVEGFQKQAMGGRRGHLDGGHKQYHSVHRHKDAPACVAPWPRLRATTSLESLHVIVEHERRNATRPRDALRSHCQGSLHGIGVILRPSRHDDFHVAPTSVGRVAAKKIPIIQVADAPIGIWIADGDVKATGTRRRLAARTQRAVASRSGTRRRLAAFGTRRAAASSGICRLRQWPSTAVRAGGPSPASLGRPQLCSGTDVAAGTHVAAGQQVPPAAAGPSAVT